MQLPLKTELPMHKTIFPVIGRTDKRSLAALCVERFVPDKGLCLPYTFIAPKVKKVLPVSVNDYITTFTGAEVVVQMYCHV